MTRQDAPATIGPLPDWTGSTSPVPAVLTAAVWSLWVASLGALALRLSGPGWQLSGVIVVDGLTVVMWVVVTFFSGIVHSYSRRYMAGERRLGRFFAAVFGFTVTVMVLVAADHVALFALAWLGMGLVMAELIGHVRGWEQPRAAAALARRYFLASSGALVLALAMLWGVTDATTISGITAAAGTVPGTVGLLAAGAVLLAAAIQSALVPFHTWLLSSMTAPTPASALMHAGFVNAGGILLLRCAPLVALDPGFMLVVVVVGAASALLGKLLTSVRPDVKTRLGCSTVGQMGFMIMQAGLGFFGAAITHLVLHGFYKAYLFLGSGSEVEHTAPADATGTTAAAGTTVATGSTAGTRPLGVVVTALTAVAGGALFAGLTGKGTTLDAGFLLTGLVVLTTMHATRNVVRRSDLPAIHRYGAVPLVFLPAIALYAAAYAGVTAAMRDVPAVTTPAELTVVHGAVAAAFLAAYVAIDTGVYRRSTRLYVALVNATRTPTATLLTDTEEYDAH